MRRTAATANRATAELLRRPATLLIIIDADCMLNRDFVQRHVDAHAFGDCEIVIGPFNIET